MTSRTSVLSTLVCLALPLAALGAAGCDCAGGDNPTTRDGGSTDAALDGRASDARIDAADGGGDSGGGSDGGADAFCGATTCGTDCADLQTDPAHCGDCTNDCTSLPHVDGTLVTCTAGDCDLTGACDAGFADCNGDPADGCETDLSTVDHCGSCGTVCSGATPLCGLDGSGARACVSDCAGGEQRCGSSCVDVMTDEMHCGDCTTACADPGHGTPNCSGGTCTPTCDPGYHACGDTCADDTAVASCGSSCTPCPAGPHSTARCSVAGACELECTAPYADCNGNATDGCEASTTDDPANCTACGHVCSGAHATMGCAATGCVIASCDAGFADCNLDPADGCEVDTTSDRDNCNGCGMVCAVANGVAGCMASACTVASCIPPFADCDLSATTGCETNVASDPGSCGGCGNVCMVPNATAGCSGTFCTVGICDPGRGDCNGQVADGCEVSTTSDASNCGSCGHICTAPNATMGCAGSSCTITSCNAGFADCNNNPVDGCEANLASPTSCGVCGRVCTVANGVAGCSAGSCTVASCNTLFGNCNGLVSDGCETNLANSTNACGSCGNDCNTTCAGNVLGTTCTAGTCQITGCTAGHFDVDLQCGGGCECTSTGTSGSCLAPTALGTLNIGQVITYTGNLVPVGTEAWLVVTFTGASNPAYHPRVRLTTNPGNAFQLDVLNNCAGGANLCGTEGGNSIGRTDWEVFSDVGYPVPPVGSSGTVYVHVYRRTGQPVTCSSYTLTVSN